MSREIPLELQKLKQQQRNCLRQEYWKLMTKPPSSHTTVAETVFDPAHQRYFSMVSTKDQFFKGTPWSTFLLFAVFFVPLGVTSFFLKRDRDAKEHLLRTGQVAYSDRKNKAI